MVVVTRFLLLCAAVLALPAIAAAQRRRPFLACLKKRDYFQTKEGGGAMLNLGLRRQLILTALLLISSPLSAGTILFEDNFDTGINPAWVMNGNNFSTVNGQLVSQGLFNASVGDSSWDNYVIEFDLIDVNRSHWYTPDPGGFSVLIRKRSDIDYMGLRADALHGWQSSLKWMIVKNGEAQEVVNSKTNLPILPSHYRIEANGNTFKVFENNAPLLVFTNDTFANGNVGLVSTGVDTTFAIDNFKVEKLGQYKPVFVYPADGQTVGYKGSYLFKVNPIANAQGFLWGFFQNGNMVWENYRDEGTLSSNEYGIHPGTTAHSKFVPGSVEVWVRALINGQWTDATIITIHLQ